MFVLGGLVTKAATTLNVTNYPSIQAAINASAPGDTVYIPNGTYAITNDITPISGIVLTGQSETGVVIHALGKNVGDMISLQNLTNVEISNLKLDGQTNTSIACGIYAYQGGFHYLHNLTIQNLPGDSANSGALAIHLNGSTGTSSGVGVTNCVIADNCITNIGTNFAFGGGIRCSWGSSRNTITGNTIALTGRGGIFGDNYCTGLIIESNTISGSGLCPPKVSGSACLGIEAWNGCSQCVIENNAMDHWLSVSGSSYDAVRRNTVRYPSGPVIAYTGLEMAGGTNCIFTDNLVDSGQQLGISISAGPTTYIFWCSNTINNLIQWAVQDAGPSYGHYFFGNTFANTQTGNTNAVYPNDEGSAFRMDAHCTNITLEANLIQSNASAAVEFLEPLANLTFISNTITGNEYVENAKPTATNLLWTNNLVSDNHSNTAPATVGYTTSQLPLAAFTAPASAVIGQAVTFTNISTAPGSAIASMLWDLGAGIPVSATTPVYAYTRRGTYRVSLIVWNTQGRAARAQEFINVTVPPPGVSHPAFSNGQMSFAVSGATNYTYVVQGSTNLINWMNLATNTPPFIFTNPSTSDSSWRFYRVVAY